MGESFIISYYLLIDCNSLSVAILANIRDFTVHFPRMEEIGRVSLWSMIGTACKTSF